MTTAIPAIEPWTEASPPSTPAKPHIVGCVHGRFQVFHNEHLEYVMAAADRCAHLYVGLTAAAPTTLHTAMRAPHRNKKINNPLEYGERRDMVEAALLEAGLRPEDFSVVRFPIETPHLLEFFVPTKARLFTTINDDWNKEKIRVLEQHGYEVEVLWERQKGCSGSDIRQRMLTGDTSWQRDVPPAVYRKAVEIDVPARLRALSATGGE